MRARKSWNKALGYYESAFEVDGNTKAYENLESLKTQIENRINKWLLLMG